MLSVLNRLELFGVSSISELRVPLHSTESEFSTKDAACDSIVRHLVSCACDSVVVNCVFPSAPLLMPVWTVPNPSVSNRTFWMVYYQLLKSLPTSTYTNAEELDSLIDKLPTNSRQ